MSPTSAQGAPPRPDLTWLRHRARPVVAAPAPAAASGGLADFLSGSDPHHPHRSPSPATASSSLDLSPPAASSSLDLSAPTQAPAASSSLDLSPAPVATPRPSVSSSLDLSAPAPTSTPAPAAAPAAGMPRPAKAVPAYQPPRARSGATTILKPPSPTVTLTRVQSGVGALTIEAACSPAVGDLRLGAAYQLASGQSSVVSHASGLAVAPPGSRRPVIAGQRGQFERLVVDLAQVRNLQRLAVYAYSESDASLQWGGTLVVTTLGQARVDLALDRPASPGVAVLLTLFNIEGELVIRAESELIAGSVRDACLAYGFDRITWLDARTPLA